MALCACGPRKNFAANGVVMALNEVYGGEAPPTELSQNHHLAHRQERPHHVRHVEVDGAQVPLFGGCERHLLLAMVLNVLAARRRVAHPRCEAASEDASPTNLIRVAGWLGGWLQGC